MAKQARAQRTREKLVSALERLLASRDFDRIAVSEIAAEAGVSVGSVYAHFRNKEAFMEALLAEREARVEARLAALDEGQTRRVLSEQGSLRAAVELAVAGALEQVRADAPLIRATHHYAALHGKERARHWQGLRRQGMGGLAIMFDVYGDEIARPDRQAAQDFFMRALESYCFNYCMTAEGDEDTVSEDMQPDMQEGELSAMLYAYLTLP